MSDFRNWLEELVFDRKLWVVVMLGMIGLMYITLPKPPTPEVITTTHQFNGQLGMVSYRNSWFGLGGPEATTLSFKNETEIIEYTFNKYLNVQTGKNYTIEYNITITTFYDMPNRNDDNPWLILFWFSRNTTKIIPISVVEEINTVASK